jgi:hypothetical protein
MMTLLASLGLKVAIPRDSDWITRGRKSSTVLAGLVALMSIVVLVQEGYWFASPDGVPLALWEILVVIVAFAAMAIACMAFALVPEYDPWNRSDRGRQIYVYAAEFVLVLIGLHVRWTLPWLFHGWLQQYWMFLVMALAFIGAGLSEWCRRRQLTVLAEPFELTGLLLPLLPAIGFWFMPEAGSPWALVGRSPATWFLMGTFYSVMAVSRRSMVCTALAVLTANVGLWVVLHEFGIAFFRHPQLWLVPVALAGLVAEYLNRKRISEAQSTAFRYMALSIIYISSTADMYIAGVGKSWLLPLVLMAFSVTGVLAGIWLRIRSFLYLGFVFLLVDVLTILWYATVSLHQTWIWYACGIALGAGIIALFAVFEKRRNDILHAVERLKEWKR